MNTKEINTIALAIVNAASADVLAHNQDQQDGNSEWQLNLTIDTILHTIKRKAHVYSQMMTVLQSTNDSRSLRLDNNGEVFFGDK